MAGEIKFVILKREAIKPSSPTPHHLRSFKLSLLDQLAPVAYGPLVFFYPMNQDSTDLIHATIAQRSQQLKKSLSKTLTQFYPLAGKIKDNISIECNDDGVIYVEARVNGILSNFLERPDAKVLKQFLPIEIESPEAATGHLLLVQASFFDCGGLAIGTLIKGWAKTALGSGETVFPEFNAAIHFPPIDFSVTRPAVEFKKAKCVVTKRFVFDASKIAALKAKAAISSVQQPTRVEAVTALIWKCAMTASRSNFGFSKLSVLSQSVNIRKRVLPPLPENSIGNLVGFFFAKTDETQLELQGLVAQLRRGIKEFGENCAKKLKGKDALVVIRKSFEEAGNMIKREDIDFFICTSLCNFSLYDIDFGWGKPIWVTIPSAAYKNIAALIDTRGAGGAEVWLTLSEEDMAFFERDQELLRFASLNPSVLGATVWNSAL